MESVVACSAGHEARPEPPSRLGSITLAALALPGLAAPLAAQVAPLEEGVIATKLSVYEDRQPGLTRVRAISPSLYIAAPIASSWSFEGSLTHDNVSGASPRWHSSISSASRMADHRTAATAKLTKSFERVAVALGGAYSDEQDYRSRAGSLELRIASEDNNRTWSIAFAHTDDDIFPTNRAARGATRRTNELGVSVTQNWTKHDVVQLAVSRAEGRGYYNDPYKIVDIRPRERNQSTATLRWNHFIASSGDALRTSYRFYTDSFGIRAHTLDAAYAKALNDRSMVTPTLRYHTQSAANFYYDPVYDPVVGEPFPVVLGRFASPDHRLSAFGAATVGVRVDWKLDSRWVVDAKLERYEQRSSWRLGGNGSPGLAPLTALIAQIGVTRTF